MASPPSEKIKFDAGEVVELNTVVRMRAFAEANFQKVWEALREKYGLPDQITYDRSTGVVKLPTEEEQTPVESPAKSKKKVSRKK